MPVFLELFLLIEVYMRCNIFLAIYIVFCLSSCFFFLFFFGVLLIFLSPDPVSVSALEGVLYLCHRASEKKWLRVWLKLYTSFQNNILHYNGSAFVKNAET